MDSFKAIILATNNPIIVDYLNIHIQSSRQIDAWTDFTMKLVSWNVAKIQDMHFWFRPPYHAIAPR